MAVSREQVPALLRQALSGRDEFTVQDIILEHPELKEHQAAIQAELDLLAVKEELSCKEELKDGQTRMVYSKGTSFELPEQFEYREKMSAGGAGLILHVFHKLRGEDQVLKLMRSGSDADAFVKEIQLLAGRFKHKAIMPIIEAGITPGGEPYFTMPYYPKAEDLGRKIRRKGSLEAVRAARIAHQIVEGLEAAHAVKVVHRDIKPDNVLVLPGDQVLILDLGIAKDLASGKSSRVTQQGQIQGTLLYMAPERFDSLSSDPAVDIFGLGVTLFEMLTGHTPFEDPAGRNDPEDVMERITKETVVFTPARDQQIPEKLQAIVRRCLRRNPKERFASAKQLREELGAFLGKDLASVTPTPIAKKRSRSSVIVMIMVITVVVGMALMHLGDDPAQDPGPAEEKEQTGAPPAPNKEQPKKQPEVPKKKGPSLQELIDTFNKDPEATSKSVLKALDGMKVVQSMQTDLFFLKARCHYHLSDLQAALEALKQIKESDPGVALLEAKILLRLNQVTAARKRLDHSRHEDGLFYDLADACSRISSLTTAQSIEELSKLAKAMRDLDRPLSELNYTRLPDKRLLAIGRFHKAMGLMRFGAEEEARKQHALASKADPTFELPLTVPPVGIGKVFERAWAAMDKGDLDLARKFLTFKDVLPEGWDGGMFVSLQTQIGFMDLFKQGRYEEVLKVTQKMPTTQATPGLNHTAARLYADADFKDATASELEFATGEHGDSINDPQYSSTIQSVRIDSKTREGRYKSKALARHGFEVRATVTPQDDSGIAYLILNRDIQQGRARMLVLRFGAKKVELVERGGATDTKVFAHMEPTGQQEYRVGVLRSGAFVLIYINGKLFHHLDQNEISLPGPIWFGALRAQIKVDSIRIIR